LGKKHNIISIQEVLKLSHIIHTIQRVSPELVRKYRELSAATVWEASGGKGALPPALKPISGDMVLCGTAVTVKAKPGDNLILHKAIYVAQAGDVLVADADSYTEAGAWGEIMAVAAQERGLAGLVLNGAARDAQAISEMGFPVFSRGLCIRGTQKISPGWINHPLTMEGVTIHPGDLVLGDRDGLVVVPHQEAAEILQKAKLREENEQSVIIRLRQGESTLDIFGLRETLTAMGIQDE
jgi:4-hydroxy-4-methyl-2-oxoglutarate aldolase